MREVVVVSYARTGLAKSVRGGFNITHGAALAGHAIQHAIERAGIEAAEVEDVVLGCGQPEGATGHNVARNAAIWAGCPVTTAGTTINRYCSSGLQSIAVGAHYIVEEGAEVVVAGGVESLSLVQLSGHMNLYHFTEEKLMQVRPDLWMPMIETADIVAERYKVSREAQDEYALQSQQRTAAAQAAGLFKDEIVPDADQDEQGRQGHRPGERRRLCGRARRVQPARDHPAGAGRSAAGARAGDTVTAGNASQMSDGAGAVVLMESKAAAGPGAGAARRFIGFTVAGCAPDEMGIGPVIAVPRLLQRHGLKVGDIDLWELNEPSPASASTAATRSASTTGSTTSTAARSPSATPMA